MGRVRGWDQGWVREKEKNSLLCFSNLNNFFLKLTNRKSDTYPREYHVSLFTSYNKLATDIAVLEKF